VNDKQSK